MYMTQRLRLLMAHMTCETYTIPDVHDQRVDHPQGGHEGQEEDELDGVLVELEVQRLGVQDGTHQLSFGCAKTCQQHTQSHISQAQH